MSNAEFMAGCQHCGAVPWQSCRGIIGGKSHHVRKLAALKLRDVQRRLVLKCDDDQSIAARRQALADDFARHVSRKADDDGV